jgi:hypothetical protein
LTTPGLTIGAVTMKITKSTNITSMYGTTLMSDIARRFDLRNEEVAMTDFSLIDLQSDVAKYS